VLICVVPLKQRLVIAAAGTQRAIEPLDINIWHDLSWPLVNELIETQTPEQPAAAQSDDDR
jgi:hypothetical protein